MDTIYYLIQKMLPVAIPLLLVALGGMFSERSGIINIALEGIMLFGAYFGVLFIYFTQASSMNPQIIFLIGMIVAMISGLVYSLLLAFGSINMKANQVIVGTAMNMFIPAVVLLFSKMFFSSDGITTNIILYINEVPILSQIPILGDILFKNTYLTVYIGLILLVVLTILLYKTKFGLRLRACGEHPHAADSVGINVYKMRYFGVMLSGALAGIGGFFYSVGITDANVSGHSGVAGFGFLALAVMIFGQWKPIRIFFAALLFAFLRALAYSIPLIPFLDNLGLDQTFYKILPYLATLIVLIFTSKKSRAPKAEGIPYDKALR
ncbi:MAG: ABC transporter permease [Acholeplasmataceae bacterium]